MKLLTFAHRGEAQHFLKIDNYKSFDTELNGLFKNEENYLLITGEGLQSAQERITTIFSQPNLNIEKVINLGIAGALDRNLEIDSILSVRSAFGEDKDINYFSSDDAALYDCISAIGRVANIDYADRLAAYASIVDREIWACAKVCKTFAISFMSIKLISDYAGGDIDSKSIIKKSKYYSENLYNYYKNNIKT